MLGITAGLCASLYAGPVKPDIVIDGYGGDTLGESVIMPHPYPHIAGPIESYFDGQLSMDAFTSPKWYTFYDITVPANPRGYSLSWIARDLRALGEKEATWQVLQDQNDIKNPHLIHPGDKIRYIISIERAGHGTTDTI